MTTTIVSVRESPPRLLQPEIFIPLHFLVFNSTSRIFVKPHLNLMCSWRLRGQNVPSPLAVITRHISSSRASPRLAQDHLHPAVHLVQPVYLASGTADPIRSSVLWHLPGLWVVQWLYWVIVHDCGFDARSESSYHRRGERLCRDIGSILLGRRTVSGQYGKFRRGKIGRRAGQLSYMNRSGA